METVKNKTVNDVLKAYDGEGKVGEFKEQIAEFRKITEDMFKLHVQKNKDYSPYNIKSTGEIGLVVRMLDKINRLANLEGFDIRSEFYGYNKKQSPKNESIEDTLMDIAVYAIISLIYKRGKWAK